MQGNPPEQSRVRQQGVLLEQGPTQRLRMLVPPQLRRPPMLLPLKLRTRGRAQKVSRLLWRQLDLPSRKGEPVPRNRPEQAFLVYHVRGDIQPKQMGMRFPLLLRLPLVLPLPLFLLLRVVPRWRRQRTLQVLIRTLLHLAALALPRDRHLWDIQISLLIKIDLALQEKVVLFLQAKKVVLFLQATKVVLFLQAMDVLATREMLDTSVLVQVQHTATTCLTASTASLARTKMAKVLRNILTRGCPWLRRTLRSKRSRRGSPRKGGEKCSKGVRASVRVRASTTSCSM
mmetsp:Transcript_71223/g.134604  ORF Transcript_71223/g.134604 Transcript_71223/m.134604 type:complete len:287 (+) Transcript_71223:81-941(+)